MGASPHRGPVDPRILVRTYTMALGKLLKQGAGVLGLPARLTVAHVKRSSYIGLLGAPLFGRPLRPLSPQ